MQAYSTFGTASEGKQLSTDVFLEPKQKQVIIKKSEVISGVSDHEAVVIEIKLYIKVKTPRKGSPTFGKKSRHDQT